MGRIPFRTVAAAVLVASAAVATTGPAAGANPLCVKAWSGATRVGPVCTDLPARNP